MANPNALANLKNYKPFKPTKNRGPGRISPYKPEYCQMLIDHMAEGKSFESFAWPIKVSPASLGRWLDKHEEFREAKALGRMASLLKHEGTGLKAMEGKVKGFNYQTWRAFMGNMHNWTDRIEQKSEVEHTVNNPGQIDMKEVVELIKQDPLIEHKNKGELNDRSSDSE